MPMATAQQHDPYAAMYAAGADQQQIAENPARLRQVDPGNQSKGAEQQIQKRQGCVEGARNPDAPQKQTAYCTPQGS
jgi:hypothetical protein